MKHETLLSYLDFIKKAESLKDTLRSAHTSQGRRESTAEHTWRLALLAFLLTDELAGADHYKILKLCLVHDLGEAVCGDTPAVQQVDEAVKTAAERAGLQRLTSGLPPKKQAEFLSLWEEYEAALTLEAKIVKGLDKLETLIQHNQGLNGPDFDYEFNLEYGQKQMAGQPLFQALRRLIDLETARRAGLQKEIEGNNEI